MKTLKNFALIASIIVMCTPDISAQKKSGKKKDFFSQEEIPYGVGGMDVPLSYSRSMQTQWSGYSETIYDPIYTMGHEVYTYNLSKNIKNSIGTGMDLHFPLIYLLACNDESRFRVADDIGVGFTMGSLTANRKDYFTNKKIHSQNATLSAVGGSLSFWAGLQAYYRVSKWIDVGVKYYPWFLYYDLGFDDGTAGRCTGLHARVANVYLDFQWISGWQKNKNVSVPVTYITKAKYLYNQKKRQFLFLNVIYKYSTAPIDYTGYPGSSVPAEVTSIKSVPSNYGVYQLGWGIMF